MRPSVYIKRGSPFWYAKTRDCNGIIKAWSTDVRVAGRKSQREAMALARSVQGLSDRFARQMSIRPKTCFTVGQLIRRLARLRPTTRVGQMGRGVIVTEVAGSTKLVSDPAWLVIRVEEEPVTWPRMMLSGVCTTIPSLALKRSQKRPKRVRMAIHSSIKKEPPPA